ncbi:putative thymidylate synthase [Bacillus phage PBC5]|nr:putative thymidylate synthase [Bacillus phage PBC5]
MKFRLVKISGYTEAILALRMSTSKFYDWKKAQKIRDMEYCLTDKLGGLATKDAYTRKLVSLVDHPEGLHVVHRGGKGELSGDYERDVQEFKRLLGLTMDTAMGKFKHHTLMKYIDISFVTEGLHRGGQDDLDAHAMGFQNRITRQSTRLGTFDSQDISEWYRGKIATFDEVIEGIEELTKEQILPDEVMQGEEKFIRTPFGYVHERYANMSPESGLYKDVLRGLMNLATPSNGIWKINLFDLRHVYASRSKIRTKANPELKDGIEQLADQVEEHVITFGEHFKHTFTDSGQWVHMNLTKTITEDEYREFKRLQKQFAEQTEAAKGE